MGTLPLTHCPALAYPLSFLLKDKLAFPSEIDPKGQLFSSVSEAVDFLECSSGKRLRTLLRAERNCR